MVTVSASYSCVTMELTLVYRPTALAGLRKVLVGRLLTSLPLARLLVGFSASLVMQSVLGVSITRQLREMTVSEWTNNPDRYQPFLTESTVTEEAP